MNMISSAGAEACRVIFSEDGALSIGGRFLTWVASEEVGLFSVSEDWWAV